MSRAYLEAPVSSFLTLAFVLIITGSFLLLPFLIYLAAVPLVFAVASLLVDSPSEVDIERKISKHRCKTGEEVEVSLRVKVEKGLGFVVIREKLPEHFELTEGSNVHILVKGLRKLEKNLTYSFKCTLRGEYVIPPTDVEVIHVLGAREPARFRVGKADTIHVLPLAFSIRRIRLPPSKSKVPLPLSSTSRMGPVTTDFREIREYRYGDPVKFINWKATARRASETPLVNEYEREGRKTVMIVLDATDSMLPGPRIGNPLELGVKVVAGLAHYLSTRSFNVMLVVAGHGIIVPPGTGSEQYVRIVNTLSKVRGVSNKAGLREVLKMSKRWIVECVPLVVLITNVTYSNADEVEEFISSLAAYYRASTRKARVPLIIIDISPYVEVATEYKHRELLLAYSQYAKKSLHSRLRRQGAVTIRWDVGRTRFGQVAASLLRLIR